MNCISSTVFLSLFAVAFSCKNGYLLERTITEEDKAKIVAYHNEYRELVASGGVPGQSPAENMMEMSWDNELEYYAQRLADTCNFEHDSYNIKINGEPVGQNLAMKFYSGNVNLKKPDYKDMVKMWFDEVYKYGYYGTFTMQTGHYSQVVWGESSKVGCGYTGYYDRSTSMYNEYLVCNYFKAGNMQGSLPYEYGSASCEKYDMVASSKYNNLCVVKGN